MPQTNAIAQLPSSGDCGFLTLQEIADRCQVSYKIVRQYADIEAVRQFMGGYYHPSSKGARYPLECEAKWRALLDAAGKRLVTPSTAAAWLTNLEITPTNAQLPSSGETALALSPVQAIAQLPQMGEQALGIGAEVVALLRQLVIQTPPAEDQLLDAREAGVILGCSPGSVRRHVRPVLRGRWRRNDILRYIQALPSKK